MEISTSASGPYTFYRVVTAARVEITGQPSGQKLWSRPGVTGVSGGWIAGSTVVVHQSRTVRVYSPAGVGPARPLPKGARISGVVGGLVVYIVGSSVRLLRLSDGRDRNLVTIKRLADAQITPAGVFYGADVATKSSDNAVVTFVQMRDVLRKLR